MISTVLPVQETDVDSGELAAAHNFNGVIVVIPEFRIAMMVGPQAITTIIRMEKEYSVVGFTTINIPGVVLTTITILRENILTSPLLVVSQCWITKP